MEENTKIQTIENDSEMKKRRELMADERRYIIYYTFGDEENAAPDTEENANV